MTSSRESRIAAGAHCLVRTIPAVAEVAQQLNQIPIGNLSRCFMREPADLFSASQCRRQADLCQSEANDEADIMIQAALRSMADQWLTLEKQIEWISETKARADAAQALPKVNVEPACR
jgi:hypothetical protein